MQRVGSGLFENLVSRDAVRDRACGTFEGEGEQSSCQVTVMEKDQKRYC